MIPINNTLKLALGSLILALPLNSLSLKNDQLQPYHITSRHAVYNRNNHTTIFTGNVVATQGSSILTGRKMILRLDNTNKQIVRLISYGQPATYTTQPEKEKERLNAEADIINYYPQRAFTTFTKDAKVVQGKDSITGVYLTYDMGKEIVTSNQKQKNSKTLIIIQPQDMH